MKLLLLKNRCFILPYTLFFITFMVFSYSFTRTEMHIWANQFHSDFFDTFFRYVTYLGDGIMVAVLVVILLFIRYRYAIAFLIASLLTSGVVHLFKKIILADMYRPSKYFELFESYQLHLIEGVKLHSVQSFPSGHTSTAFNLFMMLALITENYFLKLIYFLLATLVAFSRVYLSQHFFVDTIAGSFIAITVLFFTFYWVEKWKKPWLGNSILTKRTHTR